MLAVTMAVTPIMGAATGLSTFVLISALWGYAASWVAQILKQDGWPKWLNAIIANVAIIISAALATLTEATFTWNTFGSAVLATFVAALVNHQFILPIGGIGAALKTATSIAKAEPAMTLSSSDAGGGSVPNTWPMTRITGGGLESGSATARGVVGDSPSTFVSGNGGTVSIDAFPAGTSVTPTESDQAAPDLPAQPATAPAPAKKTAPAAKKAPAKKAAAKKAAPKTGPKTGG